MIDVVKHELIGKTITVNNEQGKVIDESKYTITVQIEEKR